MRQNEVKLPFSSFALAAIPGHEACLERSDIPNETPPEETDLHLASGNQLQIASWLGMGAPCLLLLSVLHLTLYCSVCAMVSVSSYVNQPPYV